MKDHLLSWHEKFQPLGPALKTPRIEVDEKSAIAEFEERSFDHPSCTGGNAPSLSPQALVPSPAAQVFKVGDRVLAMRKYPGVITEIQGHGSLWPGEYSVLLEGPEGHGIWAEEHLEHISQPSDTQQWVEWKGGDCPLPKGTPVVVRYRCGKESCAVRAGLNEPSPIQEDAGPAFWLHEASPFDIVAYREVQ